ncbi:hypothetical protein [Cryptosporangium minutisporangium]|uniref:Uncharacterized protein n=1 Tax=Cryptosporangium minutisporangium TaxID=113569 RepID=A0ABP6T351_9ACTN
MHRVLARTIAATAALAATAVGFPAYAADDDLKGADGRLELLTAPLPAMLSGQQGWIAGTYLADKDLCDVRITGSGPGVSISYPTNTGSYSSFYREGWLADSGLDFSALNVTVSPSVSAPVTVTLTASYIKTATGKAGDACHGSRKTQTITATLPVRVGSAPYTVKTTEVSVDRTAASWVQIVVRGELPDTGALRATLAPPPGMVVAYPGEATSAGLHGGDAPTVGTDDYFAVRIDATGLAAGTYRVPLTVTSGSTKTTTTLAVVVGGTKTKAVQAALKGKAATTAYTKMAAARLCALRNRVYPTPTALQAAYRAVEKASGLSTAQITAFDRKATTDSALRKAIVRQYKATCR